MCVKVVVVMVWRIARHVVVPVYVLYVKVVKYSKFLLIFLITISIVLIKNYYIIYTMLTLN